MAGANTLRRVQLRLNARIGLTFWCMPMRETLIKLGLILTSAVIPTLIGLYLLSQWQQDSEPLQLDVSELKGLGETGRVVEVRNCVPDYERGCAIYEDKSKRILSRYVPLREAGKPDGQVYALLQYDTAMQSYWVAEGLVLGDGDDPGATAGDGPDFLARRDALRARSVRGIALKLSATHEKLINQSKSGWQVTSPCIVIEENKTHSPWKGALVIAFGWVCALAWACLFYLHPLLAMRRNASVAGKKPNVPPLTASPMVAIDAPAQRKSAVALQYRVLIYPLWFVLAATTLWSLFLWEGYSRGAQPLESSIRGFKPGENSATCLAIDGAHLDLTFTVATYEYTARMDGHDAAEYYVPLTEKPDDERPIKAFLRIASNSEMHAIVREFEQTREDGAAARACAERYTSKLRRHGRFMGRTDWGLGYSRSTRDQLTLQYEGLVDPDFVIIDDGRTNDIWVPVMWSLPAVFTGLVLGWLLMQVRSLSVPSSSKSLPPGPKPSLVARLRQ